MSSDFFATLWPTPSGFGEIRTIYRPPNSRPVIHQMFVDLARPDAHILAADIAHDADVAGHNVYCGVLRRTRRGGTSADVVDHASVLWADVDPYKEVGTAQCADGLVRVLNFPLSPSIIVDSGHGIHAYWLLREAAATADATLAMKGIARDIGGDHTYDAARILRVPGTVNQKDGMPPVPVRLLRLDTTRRYRFSDFSEWVDKAHEGRGTPRSWYSDSIGVTYERRADLPPWLDELIANGAPRGSRSEQSFKCAVWLMRYGWSDEQIKQAFAGSPNGIGAKYAERGDRWLAVTLAAARAQA